MDDRDPAAHSASTTTRTPLRVEVLWAAVAAVASTVVAAWKVGAPGSLSGLWGHFDLSTSYAGARALESHAWISPNADLGFPFGQDLAGFPAPDLINVLQLKVLAVVTHDALVAVNVYLLASFAVIAVSMYALLRVVRVPTLLSAALATSFTLVPWHFERFTHSGIANYSPVAVGLILVVAVLSWNLALSGPDRARAATLWGVLALAVYVGLSGTYYAVFTTILALVALVFQVLLGRRGRALIPAAWFAVLPAGISIAAALAYRLTSTAAVPTSLARAPEESQLYGGALFTLLRTTDLWSSGWPIPGLHLVPTVASALESDARNSTVGLVAVVVAFACAGLILAANGLDRARGLVSSLGYWPWLFMVSLLFFVVAGFGQVFAVFLTFQIRSWGRLAIVVIAIAYVILGLVLAHVLERSRRRRTMEIGAGALIVGITLLDVVSMPAPVDTAVATAEADELRSYGTDLDAALPDGCGVFTLPAYLFPEGIPGDGTDSYDPLLPYLFAQHPRWSYGGVRGTAAGDWQYDQVSRHVPTLVQQLVGAGFCAVQVDTRAFSDDDSPVPDLEGLLGDPVARSTSDRWLTFSLDSAQEGPFSSDYVFDQVTVMPGFGFDPTTVGGSRAEAVLRGTDATLFIVNPRRQPETGMVEMEVEVGDCAPGGVVLSSGDTDGVTVEPGTSTTARLPLAAPAGDVVAIHVGSPGACEVTVVNPRFIPDSLR